jgi:pimeloyl-ACP methyl ester carboxylesterase
MGLTRLVVGVAVVALVGLAPVTEAAAKTGGLPPPVEVRQEPEVGLADPAFTALPGATADFGRLGGAVYQIEMPDDWNGRLVLYMHGFENFGPEAAPTAPDFRRYLVGHGYAWGASSFSSTSFIPVRSADETAALWDFFAQKYGRPKRSYVTGLSMGGAATNVAATRYGDRFDGALGLCGASRAAPGETSPASDFFTVGAYLAGVSQGEYDGGDITAIIRDRIQPALALPSRREQFEQLVVDLTGGARPFGLQGVRIEEATNWRRAEQLVLALAARNRRHYRVSDASGVSPRDFNRSAIRYRVDRASYRSFMEDTPASGELEMPLLTMHTTGDGQVPIEQAQILRRLVHRAGKGNRLVQRVYLDPGHCGFTTEEQERAFAALVDWVEHGRKPAGTDLSSPDLRHLDRTFEISPRAGSRRAGAIPGGRDRVVINGRAALDGRPLDAQFLGAVVTKDGLETPCQNAIPSVAGGRFRIPVAAASEVRGCGRRGSQVVLWTYVDDVKHFATRPVPWPGRGRTVRDDVEFSTADPQGAAPAAVEIAGEVYRSDGTRVPLGSSVEAYVGDTRCAIASVRRSGSFSGFVVAVVGPETIPGCDRGAMLTFRVDGRPALESAPNVPGRRDLLDLTVSPPR